MPNARTTTGEGSARRVGLDRQEVVQAAVDLVCNYGTEALTMRRLATELDVATTAIYWHVGSRDEVVVEVIRHQAALLSERTIIGETAQERVVCAAHHVFDGAIANPDITRLAHQTRTTALLEHRLEATLAAELNAAGLQGKQAAGAHRAIRAAIGGLLVLALADQAATAPEFRPTTLWAESGAPIESETLSALADEPDMDAMFDDTIPPIVAHHLLNRSTPTAHAPHAHDLEKP